MPGQSLITIHPHLHTPDTYVYCGRENTHGQTIYGPSLAKVTTTIVDIGLSDQPSPKHRLQNNVQAKYDALNKFLNATSQSMVNDTLYTVLADQNDAAGYQMSLVELENVLTRLFVLGSGHTPACGFTGGSRVGAYLIIEQAAKVAPRARYHFWNEPQAFVDRILDFDAKVFQPWVTSHSTRKHVGPSRYPVGIKLLFGNPATGSVKRISAVDCGRIYGCPSSVARRDKAVASTDESKLLNAMQNLI